MKPDTLRGSDLLNYINSFFTTDVLEKWVREVEACDGKHDYQCIIQKVRKITLDPQFNLLKEKCRKNAGYMIPDTSWVGIEGIDRDVPRGICMDAILFAQIMVYSKAINHGLSDEDLKEIYTHHCLETIVNVGQALRMSSQESLKVLHLYIARIAASTF